MSKRAPREPKERSRGGSEGAASVERYFASFASCSAEKLMLRSMLRSDLALNPLSLSLVRKMRNFRFVPWIVAASNKFCSSIRTDVSSCESRLNVKLQISNSIEAIFYSKFLLLCWFSLHRSSAAARQSRWIESDHRKHFLGNFSSSFGALITASERPHVCFWSADRLMIMIYAMDGLETSGFGFWSLEEVSSYSFNFVT